MNNLLSDDNFSDKKELKKTRESVESCMANFDSLLKQNEKDDM